MSKIDYKSAYQQGTLRFVIALQAVTHLPEDNFLILAQRLTFGGAPCLYKWGVVSETICNLANELLKCDDWEPLTLHASVQKETQTRVYLDEDVPFAIGRELIVDTPINHRATQKFSFMTWTGVSKRKGSRQ